MKWNNWLQADFVGPREWVLTEPLKFEIDKFRVPDMVHTLSDWSRMELQLDETPNTILITAPVGYHTDLASVSRAMWAVISPWDVARGAVIHDVLYGALRKFKESDPYAFSRTSTTPVSESIYSILSNSIPPS